MEGASRITCLTRHSYRQMTLGTPLLLEIHRAGRLLPPVQKRWICSYHPISCACSSLGLDHRPTCMGPLRGVRTASQCRFNPRPQVPETIDAFPAPRTPVLPLSSSFVSFVFRKEHTITYGTFVLSHPSWTSWRLPRRNRPPALSPQSSAAQKPYCELRANAGSILGRTFCKNIMLRALLPSPVPR